MYCHKCGVQNEENAYKCIQCGTVLVHDKMSPLSASQTVKTKHVPNYLAWSILATLFCCLPGGIVAIIYSDKVNSRLRAGDYEGAMNASQNAKTWCWVSFGVGLFFIMISIIAGIFSGY